MKRLALVISMLVLFAISLQATSAASFSDLTSYQKQKYWDMMGKECIPLLMSQQYTAYRTCALDVMEKASQLVEADVAWCNDSDGVDFMQKGIVKTDLEPNGIEDYVYTWDGTDYIIEGGCSDSKQYMMYFKNCAELGEKYVADVATASCVFKNAAPVIEAIGDKTVKEGELLKFEVKASDADGDALVWSVEGLPAGAKFENGVFEWTPDITQAGQYLVTITVDDGMVKVVKQMKIIVENLPTEFCGIVSQNTVLTKVESPYLVKCHILVEKGVTLTIQPGVEVRFDGPYYMKVEGTLIANGTKDQIILFTSNKKDPKPGDWDKIKFEDSSTDWNGTNGSIIRNAKIEYSGFFTNETITINSASPLIENNEITNFLGVGIQGQSLNLSPVINNNTFSKGGLAIVVNGNFKVTNNKITDLSGDGIVCNNGSPLIENNNISASSTAIRTHGCAPLIKNNVITNSISGIRLFYYGSGSVIMNNTITNSSTMGIYVFWSGTVGFGVKIENNTIKNADTGLFLLSPNNNIEVVGNTISNSNIGVKIDSSSVVTIKNNTIKDNVNGIYIDTDSQDITLTNNNIYNNSTYSIYLKGPSGNPFGNVKAENNYWGTIDTALIDKMIFDFYDNFDLPKFIYKPIAEKMFVW